MADNRCDCKERVALELAQIIHDNEFPGQPKERAYWLQLYRQALRVVSGAGGEVAPAKSARKPK